MNIDRRLAALALMAGLGTAAIACSGSNSQVSTNTSAAAATSTPGSSDTKAHTSDTKDERGDGDGTTLPRKKGPTSTTKGDGTSTTEKSTSKTTTKKSTATTKPVDTPADAKEFCAAALDFNDMFENVGDDPDQFLDEVRPEFDALTALAPDAIADEMNKVNDLFQSGDNFEEIGLALDTPEYKKATDAIDDYMDENCGFTF